MCLWGTACVPHEDEPSLLDFELHHNSIFIKIQTDLEVLFDIGFEEIDLSYLIKENSLNKTVSENPPNLDIIDAVFRNWPLIKSDLFFVVDGGPLELELSDVLLEVPNPITHGIPIILSINALIPIGSTFLTLGWNDKLGDLVVRQQGDRETLYTEYMTKGMKTSKIQLE
tara:strand:+ start:377 stop:886 length:510 start_codon:yes stop_codon:yes gene_type:complete